MLETSSYFLIELELEKMSTGNLGNFALDNVNF